MAGEGVEVLGEVKPSEGVVVLGEAAAPPTSEVLSAIPEQVGLGFIEAGGGILRGVGDLLHIDTISDLGAEVARNAKGAAADITPAGQSLGQEILSGGIQSAAQMLPAIAAGPAALAPAGIALAAGTQAGSRYSEIRDAGFSGGRAAFHAGIEGLAEALGEAISLPVLAQSSRPFLNKLYHFMARDLAGEEFTTTVEQTSALLSDRPDMTWRDFLSGLAMTALQTPVAAGLQVGATQLHPAFRGTNADLDTTSMPSQGQGTPPPPVSEPPPTATPAKPAATPDNIAKPGDALDPGAPDTTAKPAATANSVGLPPGWNAVDTDAGQQIRHDSGHYIRETHDGWQVILAGPDGTGYTEHAQLSKDQAVRFAQAYGFDQAPPPGWTFDPANGGWQSDGGYSVKVVNDGGMPRITLYGVDKAPIVEFIDYSQISNEVLAKADKRAASYAAGLSPAPQQPQYATVSAYDTTPDQMVQQQAFDPRIFNGAYSPKYGHQMVVRKNEDGSWQVDHTSYTELSDVMGQLQNVYGFDLQSVDQIGQLYNRFMLDQMVRDPSTWLDIAPNVDQYFGGRLMDLSQAAAKAGMQPRNALTEPRVATGFGKVDIEALRFLEPEYLGADRKTVATNSVDAVAAVQPGTYLPLSENGPAARKLAAWVDSLRLKYAPDMRIYLQNGTTKGQTGATRMLGPGHFLLYLRDMGKMERVSDLLKTAAHEFGHAIIHHHFIHATPEVQAALTTSWLQYTRSVRKETSLLRYLIEHHGDPRSYTIGEGVEIRDLDSGFQKYILSQSEYFADQAAMHFLFKHGPEVQQQMPSIAEFFNQLINKLLTYWQTAVASMASKFRPNTDFVNYLDSLAQSGKKVSAWISPARDEPKATPGKKPKAVPLKTKEQVAALYEKRRRLMVAMFRARVPSDVTNALGFSDRIEDFDWQAAFKVAEQYGVPESWYGGRLMRESWDDTSAFRRSMQEMGELVPDSELPESISQRSSDIKGFNWLLQRTMTAVQLRKKFGDLVPGVKQFVDNLEKMWAYRSRWKEIADGRVKEMRQMGKAERERVFRLLLDEDKSGEFQSTVTQDAAGRRIYTPKPETVGRYRLSDKGVQLYMSLRADFANALDELEDQAISELERTYSAGPALVKAETELKAAFAEMRNRPYVPHTRFGDYTVTVRRNGAVVEFYQFESERAAKAHEAKLRARMGAGDAVSRGKMTDIQKSMMGMPPQLILAMKAQLKLTPEQIAEFEDILKDMTNAASFVRRFKHRKDIAGWEDDTAVFPRAYADYMTKFANHVSRLKYNHLLGESTQMVRSQALDAAKMGVNTVELNDLASWLNRLHEYINEPGQEYAAARAAGTLWYLGFNVKSALVNSTSVPMVTVPYLSSRVGWTRAFSTVTQAYKDIASSPKKLLSLTDDERKMLAELRRQNKIDASFASELAGLREGGRLSDQTALSKPMAAFYGVRLYGMWMFQKMEVVNREVTALATYRLYRVQRDFDPDAEDGFDRQAMEKAGLAVQDTQNENAQWNRPELMRGRKSVLTMFMSYQQNMIYQMFGGDESWMRLLAVQMMTAGLMGIPFAQDADELVKWFSRKVFGSDISAEKALRAYLKDAIGDPDWVLKGASHNVFNLDLSGSLSQGRVIPGIDALAMEGDFPTRLANAAGDVGGAGFSIILNFMKAVASNDPSWTRRFQRSMPEFFRAAAEGGNMLAGGKAIDSQGRPLTDVSQGDAFMRMLGFQVANVQSEKGKRFAQQDTAQFWLTRRAYVLGAWELAVESHDPSWREKAMDALREFNEEAPDAALKITRKQLNESIKRRVKSDAMASLGLAPSKTVQQTYDRVATGYQ